MGRGGRGKPFGKGFPLPPRAPPSPLPKLFIQVHATVSQRPGQPSRSGPPVPWRGCTVEGRAALPCPISVSACASCSGQAAQSAFRKAAGNRLGADTGRRKRDKGSGQPFRLPGHDGQPPGTANSLDKSCAMVCHKSRKFLFFWAGACGRRRHPSWAKGGTGIFPHSGKIRWAVLESGEKRSWRGEKSGCNGWAEWIRRQAGMPHRAVAQKASVLPDLPEGPCRKREPRSCTAPTLHSVSACPGPTDHCMLATIQDRAVVCRKICPDKARWEGEGV